MPTDSKAASKAASSADSLPGRNVASSEKPSVISAPPTSDSLPRGHHVLWVVFVLVWSLIFGIVGLRLAQGYHTTSRAGSWFCLVTLTATFLWVNLVVALGELRRNVALTRARLGARLGSIGVMAACVIALRYLVPDAGVWWLMQHPVVTAGLALPALWAVPVGLALVAASLVLCAEATGTADPVLLTQVAFGAAALTIRLLTVTVLELQRTRRCLVQVAVDDERRRLSRDLHDLLGNSLSTIILKSELAARLAAPDAVRVKTELTDIERTARHTLREVRAAVLAYRPPELSLELRRAEELLAAAHIGVTLEGDPDVVAGAAAALFAWGVREGVTNVVRHSRARHCVIRLRGGQSPELRIEDDGVGGSANESGGMGLRGLGERASQAGARLSARRGQQSGFCLTITLNDPGAAGSQPV